MPKTLGLAFLLWIALAATAGADTVYLRNGETVWGSSIYEEGNEVVVERPSGKVRIPKADVMRVDGLKSSLPPFYSPPSAGGTSGGPESPGPLGAPLAPGTPGAPAAPASPTAAGPAPAASAPAPAPPPPGAPASPYRKVP